MKSCLEKNNIEHVDGKETSNVSEKRNPVPQSRHYGVAIEYYNKAQNTSGANRRKLLYDSLAELEQAILEDGENKTYSDFRGCINAFLQKL